MSESEAAIDHAAVDAAAQEHGFSGVIRIDHGGETQVARAYGDANRALGVPNRLDTRFGIASGVKGLTALTVMSLVEDGVLTLETRARALLGDDLPLVGDGVTVEHLLAHRSGIGDYLDENDGLDITDYVMPVPVHQLADTQDYLRVLDGHVATFAPDERFAYCNGGYVVLALLAERAAETPFHDLVAQRVCAPGGDGRHRVPPLGRTAGRRGDRLPAPRGVAHQRVAPAGPRQR